MNISSQKLEFKGHSGAALAARLDTPSGPVRAYALFAHCFTCSKDLLGARRLAAELSRLGIAVLRFDFTGLGSSKGEFASTNFSTNIADLKSAAAYLREHFKAPEILIGHSLGGAAVLVAAADLPETRAIATIGAPSDAGHVIANFGVDPREIEKHGRAEVTLGGRPFEIRRQFLEDLRESSVLESVRSLKKPLLLLHSPRDEIVGIEHASRIFQAAWHPKSFVSLDDADHLLTRDGDAAFCAAVIGGWVSRYLQAETPQGDKQVEHVRVTETGEGKFQNIVQAGRHRLFADEPETVGGMDSGPSPYDFLSMALGSCTAMTLRMYFDRKKTELGRITVDVAHEKMHASDCRDCTDEEKNAGGRIDRFTRMIDVEGGIPPEHAAKILEIADKCPVHRTLVAQAKIVTSLTGKP